MSLYEGIKDVAKVVQQADNVELYRQLLDLGSQALEMQAEIAKLREENAELKKGKELEGKIIRHTNPYITLEDCETNMWYCAICWDSDRKLIQMKKYTPYSSPELLCNKCKNRCRFDQN